MRTRDERRTWKTAQSFADLGELMAAWLEGSLTSWPGYQRGCGPDDETRPLIPTLVSLNRGGYLTTNSQPGESARAFDGGAWEQRAWVDGFIADKALLDRVQRAGARHGWEVIVAAGPTRLRPRDAVITTWHGRPHTTSGRYLSGRALRGMWPGISRAAFRAVEQAWQVSVIAPDYGPGGQRMWAPLSSLTQ